MIVMIVMIVMTIVKKIVKLKAIVKRYLKNNYLINIMKISELLAFEDKMMHIREIFKALRNSLSKQIQELKRIIDEESPPIMTQRITDIICEVCGRKTILIKYTYPNKIHIKRYICLYCQIHLL